MLKRNCVLSFAGLLGTLQIGSSQVHAAKSSSPFVATVPAYRCEKIQAAQANASPFVLLNSQGDIAFTIDTPSGERPAVWNHNGNLETLKFESELTTPDSDAEVRGLNDVGDIVGTVTYPTGEKDHNQIPVLKLYAYFYHGDTFTRLWNGEGLAVSPSGIVAGYATTDAPLPTAKNPKFNDMLKEEARLFPPSAPAVWNRGKQSIFDPGERPSRFISATTFVASSPSGSELINTTDGAVIGSVPSQKLRSYNDRAASAACKVLFESVSGASLTNPDQCVWDKGVVSSVGHKQLNALNDNSEYVGGNTDAILLFHGKTTRLNPILGVHGSVYSSAVAINNAGQIAGTIYDLSTDKKYIFRLTPIAKKAAGH